jgi:hypothetical protein
VRLRRASSSAAPPSPAFSSAHGNPKVAVTIVAAPKPDAQSIRFGPSAVLFIAQTLPSACG